MAKMFLTAVIVASVFYPPWASAFEGVFYFKSNHLGESSRSSNTRAKTKRVESIPAVPATGAASCCSGADIFALNRQCLEGSAMNLDGASIYRLAKTRRWAMSVYAIRIGYTRQ
jgi:hypothetical protein